MDPLATAPAQRHLRRVEAERSWAEYSVCPNDPLGPMHPSTSSTGIKRDESTHNDDEQNTETEKKERNE